MSFSVVVDKRALKDLQQAISYYDEQQIGLGKRFADEVDKYISLLSENPFYQLRYKDYRALPIKKFPFLILFYVNESTKSIYITSVFQTKQSPKKLPR